MVKIGEIEFLVKFDNVGKQFKDIIEESMEDVVSFDMDNIENELRYIRAYMGVLKTPFSGGYEVDLIKKNAYVQQLADEDYLQDIIARISVSKTAMGYFDPKHEIELGSEEAEELARRNMENIFARILDMFEKGFASKTAYAEYGGKIRKTMKLFETATETELSYLLKNVIGYINKEAETDRKIVVEALDKNAEAAITDAKAHFATIAKEINEGSDEIIVKSERDFMEALTEYLSKDNIKKLMTSATVVLQGSLRDEIGEMIKKVKFEPTNFPVPRAFLKTVEDITGLTGLVGKIKVADVRAVFTELEEIMSAVDEFHTEKTPEDVEKLKDTLTQLFEDFGWMFAVWENKGVGSIRSLQKDKEPWANWPVFAAQVAGTGGAQVKARFLDFEKNITEVAESIISKDPERRDKAVTDSLESIKNILMATYGNTEDIPKNIKEIIEALEKGTSSTFTE